MSPILVRPVREQLEHDRVIRLLQAKYKRKFEVAINPGNERGTPVGPPTAPWYPDLVLQSPDRFRRVLGVVEVETVESVNHLEAMSQWAALARLKAPFLLYVPVGMIDVARRYCTDLQITVGELWAYQALGDQVRFTPIHRMNGADDEPGGAKDGRRGKSVSPKASAPKASAPKPVSTRAVASKVATGKASVTKASVTKTSVAKAGVAKAQRPSGAKASESTARKAKSSRAAAGGVKRTAGASRKPASKAGKSTRTGPPAASRKAAPKAVRRK